MKPTAEHRQHLPLIALLAAGLFAAACSFDAGAIAGLQGCEEDADCSGEQTCEAGRCVGDTSSGHRSATSDPTSGRSTDTPGNGRSTTSDTPRSSRTTPPTTTSSEPEPSCPETFEEDACGGCADPPPGGLGESCGPCEGQEWTCQGTRYFCPPLENGCGGCSPLPALPGVPCGTCDSGRYVCDGEDALRCEGDRGDDARTLYCADRDGDGYGDPDTCELACDAPTGYVDNAMDCDDEDASINPGASDRPEFPPVDRNCDGVDGDAARSIFVHPEGDDEAVGTREAPLQTIGAALQLAAQEGARDVLVAEGVYGESLVLPAGVSLYGGYSAEDWSDRDLAYESEVRSPEPVAVFVASSAQAMAIEGMVLVAAPGVYTAPSSIGLLLDRVSGTLQVRHNRIEAARGADGRDGPAGTIGVAGTGVDPSGDSEATNGALSGCDAAGGDGGRRGRDGVAPLAGLAGQAGSTGRLAPGGAPGNAGCRTAGDGDPGEDGSPGVDAAPVGQPAEEELVPLIGLQWRASDGLVGQAGAAGGGGGGGGGGARTNCGVNNASGGGGGGGGSGGCGGQGGTGGEGAGASIGVFVTGGGSRLVLRDNDIRSADGGEGGRGGDGGPGGAGGGGGPGADGRTAGTALPRSGGDGGDGGDGGPGGSGSGGSGGGGGWSAAILLQGVSGDADIDENLLTHGDAGSGGDGGLRADGAASDAGRDGRSGSVLTLED